MIVKPRLNPGEARHSLQQLRWLMQLLDKGNKVTRRRLFTDELSRPGPRKTA
jgi:hypothetical protein